MTRMIDLSADIGESFGSYRMGNDAELLESLTSANVACGFHAGDPRVMQSAVADCVRRGVAVGAHPGFPDLVGFGRRAIETSPEEVRTDVLYQIGALSAFARAAGTSLTHVSPHGRLGNLVVSDERYAGPVADAVQAFDPALVVVTYSGALERMARERGLPVGLLGFPDRGYEDDGTLVSRREPGAVLHEPELIAERAVRMATDGTVVARSGREIEVEIDSLLLHGDNAASVLAARQVRRALEDAGVVVAPLSDVLRVGAGAGRVRAEDGAVPPS
jgi:5-oxoprolinase (ATP-hydrolysing) subunit A